MTLFCSPAVLLCLLAMVDPAAACFPLFLPQTLALPSFHCFSHLFHCYCFIVLPQTLALSSLHCFSHLFHHFCFFALALLFLCCFSLLKSWRHFPRRHFWLCMFCAPFFIQEHGTVICSFFVLLFYFTLAAFFSFVLTILISWITSNTWNPWWRYIFLLLLH